MVHKLSREEMEEKELNTCDRCGSVESTYDLIWITSEDFTPKKGEIVPKWAFKKYDALCPTCYMEIIKVK
jgi:hypothetical protein